jgi:anthranilate/para-aminobenzoate synthase component II
MKVRIIDFFDSFTFNIVSEFYAQGIVCEVVSYIDFLKRPVNLDIPLLLGPGPGSVEDYQNFYTFFEDNYFKKLPTAGICLGHQFLCHMSGMQVVKSKHIVHGDTVEIELNDFWKKILNTSSSSLDVQRYNSQTVELESKAHKNHLYSIDGELMGTISENFISYQFHPESVGTSCRKNFTTSLLNYLL